MQQSKKWIVGRLLALAMLTGGGGAFYAQHQGEVARAEVQAAAADPYVQAVARDASTSDAVKIAMLMGHLYESSGKHVGTPYIDKLGRGQPLTVCNGITGAGVVAGKWYTPADCYELEKGRYLQAERAAKRLLAYWASYDAITQATFLDFIHNKGEGAFAGSTMLRKANAGDLVGACRENPRRNRGTVNGVSVALPGLMIRADANGELCEGGL